MEDESSTRDDRDSRGKKRFGRQAARDSRNRSYSPQPEHKNQRQKHIAGFRWKEKRQPDNNHRDQDHHDSAISSGNHMNNGSGTTRRLERGYRNRSRSPMTRRNNGQTRNLDNDNRGWDTKREKGYNIEDKFGSDYSTGSKKIKSGEKEKDFVGEKNQQKASDHGNSSVATSGGKHRIGGGMTQQQEPMIIVHVNDRLGTRAAIPCLASDPIGLFKAQVAARIGRQTHEIMLKRQGERPFKDQLTLEDYGISNGVQIDLEIDTGD